jgi:hypothetical protein
LSSPCAAGARLISGGGEKKKGEEDQLFRSWFENVFTMTEEEKQRKAEIEALVRLVEEGMSKKGLLSEMELSTEAAKQELGQRLMDEKLKAQPPEDGRPKACPRCGAKVKVRAKDVPRTFKSLSGSHTYWRNYIIASPARKAFTPETKSWDCQRTRKSPMNWPSG